MIKIYHNPRCSKSRQTLAILEETGNVPEIIEYLKTGLTEQDIKEILQKLDISALELIRSKDAKKSGFDLATADCDALVLAMVKNPSLVERPVVITENGACLGRPPENVYNIL